MLNYASQYRFHYPQKLKAGFQVRKEKLFGGASATLSAIATSRCASGKELTYLCWLVLVAAKVFNAHI
jgi:hypothetical protein